MVVVAGCGGDWWYLTPFLAQSFTRKLRTQRASSGPTHKRTDGRAPVWGSEYTSKNAAVQGGGDRGVQAVARCAARCALHVHGRCARTDACGLSFTVLSTQVSTVGLRLQNA